MIRKYKASANPRRGLGGGQTRSAAAGLAPAKIAIPAAGCASRPLGQKIFPVDADIFSDDGKIKSADKTFLTPDKMGASPDLKFFLPDK